MHEHPLPQCEMFKNDFIKHKDESVGVRDNVSKNCQQILTLEKAHEATMADIQEIKRDIVIIKQSQQDLLASVKIWVLGGVLSTLLAFTVPVVYLVFYVGQVTKQGEVVNERVSELEHMFPRGK